VTESDPMLIDSDDEQGDIHDDNSNDHKPHIIIVPASVLSNWEREFNRFCPDMKVVR
jgi:SNF2 family DNA or RNA helicase